MAILVALVAHRQASNHSYWHHLNGSQGKKRGHISAPHQLNESVPLLVWLSAGISGMTFLCLFAFAKLAPENGFVQKFLGGGGLVLAGLFIFVLNFVIVSLIENRTSKHRDPNKANTER